MNAAACFPSNSRRAASVNSSRSASARSTVTVLRRTPVRPSMTTSGTPRVARRDHRHPGRLRFEQRHAVGLVHRRPDIEVAGRIRPPPARARPGCRESARVRAPRPRARASTSPRAEPSPATTSRHGRSRDAGKRRRERAIGSELVACAHHRRDHDPRHGRVQAMRWLPGARDGTRAPSPPRDTARYRETAAQWTTRSAAISASSPATS